MSRFLNKSYEDLEVYTPGEQPLDKKYIKLNTNESPYSPSERVISAITDDEVKNLRLYPDPTEKKLSEKIASLYGVKPCNIFLSNGSDDILNFAFMAFTGEGVRAVFPDISYGFYPVYANLHKVDYTEIPLKEDFTININEYCNTDCFTVIANPNAPTGISLSIEEVEKIISSNRDRVVLIDEAYVDFGGESVYPLIEKYDNLLVVQTFSKSRCLAGGRLGFAIASDGLIEDLNKIKYSTNPYNVNRITLVAGEASIDSNDYYMERAKQIIDTRAYTTDKLNSLGFRVLPSSANFVFAASDRLSGDEIYRRLKDRGILVRHFTKERIKNYNRITIGTRAEMETLISTLSKILSEV